MVAAAGLMQLAGASTNIALMWHYLPDRHNPDLVVLYHGAGNASSAARFRQLSARGLEPPGDVGKLRAVRGDGTLRDIRILALSAHALSDEVRQIREAGADAYLAKPADPKAVLDAVRALMERE